MPVTDAILLQQLYLLRGQLELVIAMAEGAQIQPEPEGCQHPDEKRKDTTTMGGERQWMCLVCGQRFLGAL